MTALVFCDGFDKYGPPGNVSALQLLGEWTLTGTSPTITTPLSSLGGALRMTTSSISLVGQLPAAMTRVAGSFRVMKTDTNATIRVGFQNSATAAFSITINATTNVLEIRTGIATGTVLASGGFIAQNTAVVISYDVTIGASSAYTVYLNGVSLLSGTGNTGNGQTSVNNVIFANGSAACTLDDFVVLNPADAAYSSTALTGNIIVETQFPNGDNQKQFINDSNLLWPASIIPSAVHVLSTGSAFPGANRLVVQRVTPVTNCTLNSVTVLPGQTTAAKLQMVAYADSSGLPGALLTAGTEIVGTSNGVFIIGALTTPQSLTAGTSVWIGFIIDTSIAFSGYDNALTSFSQTKSATYTSGAPSSGAGTASFATLLIWGNCTGAADNFASVMLNPPATTGSQIHSLTVGDEDLYNFPALLSGVTSIYGVAVKGFLNKSDSGARTGSLNMKSSTTDSTGSNPGFTLSTTNQWIKSMFDLDPNTSAAWTASNLNAAKSGVSVAS
jgi:hypothetical protein